MSDDSRIRDLTEKYLDGALSEPELAELQRLVVGDAGDADALYAAAQQDERLFAHFRQQRDSIRIEQIVQGVTVSPDRTPREKSRKVFRRKPWQACAAACVLSAVGIGLYLAFVRGPAPRGSVHEVVAGSVRVNGVETKLVSEAVMLEVGGAGAVIRLADGSRAELAPGTNAVIRGRVGEFRQVIALDRGSGQFEVEKGDRRFRVETPVGSVTALGTEFTVEVRPDEAMGRDKAADLRLPALVVGVIAGQVEVDYNDQTYSLALGDDRIFATAHTRHTREPDLVGKVIAVSDDLRSITIEKDEAAAHQHPVITALLSKETAFSWVNIPVDHQAPSLGYHASVWLRGANNEDASAVRFSVEHGAGPPPDVMGHVVHVSDHGRSITLRLPGGSTPHATPATQLVKLDEKTSVEYSFVRFDGEIPTAGYHAAVWIKPGSTDVARVVHFVGDKRGDHKPSLSGRVVHVFAEGDAIEIVHPEKEVRFHPESSVIRSKVRIGQQTKVLYHNVPAEDQRPMLGSRADVWLEHGSHDLAAGITFSREDPHQDARHTNPK